MRAYLAYACTRNADTTYAQHLAYHMDSVSLGSGLTPVCPITTLRGSFHAAAEHGGLCSSSDRAGVDALTGVALAALGLLPSAPVMRGPWPAEWVALGGSTVFDVYAATEVCAAVFCSRHLLFRRHPHDPQHVQTWGSYAPGRAF